MLLPAVLDLFVLRVIQVLIFVRKQDEAKAKEYILPLAKQHTEKFKFVLADPEKTKVCVRVLDIAE